MKEFILEGCVKNHLIDFVPLLNPNPIVSLSLRVVSLR